MATAGKLQKGLLTCSVCMEVYQQPVTLACQHSFCKNCLRKYLLTKVENVNNKSIPCPTCRQETQVPHPDRPVEEWAGQLKPGLLLTGLIDSLQETATCSYCKEEGETTPSTHWCSECEAGFCDSCLKMHGKMPLLRQHIVTNLADPSSGQRIRGKFICREHDKKMKLYCKDCRKPLCTVCCSISHRKCDDVVTIQAMLPEVKGQIQDRQIKLQIQMEKYNAELKCYEEEIQMGTEHKLLLKSEIEKIFEKIAEHLQKKKDQLIKKLEDQSGEQTGQLRSKVKTKQINLQMFQQQSQFIQQALELEDEKHLFEMYLSPGSELAFDVQETQREDMSTISFIEDVEQLKAEIDKIDVKVEKKDDIDLTAKPLLQRSIEAKSHKSDKCMLVDVAVLNVKNRKVTVVTDYSGNRIKSLYTLSGNQQCSTLVLDNYPWSIVVLNDHKVAVTVPSSNKIVTVNVNPDLELHSTLSTDKKYHGLDVLDQSTYVASSVFPPSVDVLDMEGRVMRSLHTLPEPHKTFLRPSFIHITREGTILVSDCILESVICLAQTGHVEWLYKPSGVRALTNPRGIKSTRIGDILVADRDTHKVVHLSRGEFVRDILTKEDGVENPYGLCLDGDKLCVANQNKGVYMYQFRK